MASAPTPYPAASSNSSLSHHPSPAPSSSSSPSSNSSNSSPPSTSPTSPTSSTSSQGSRKRKRDGSLTTLPTPPSTNTDVRTENTMSTTLFPTIRTLSSNFFGMLRNLTGFGTPTSSQPVEELGEAPESSTKRVRLDNSSEDAGPTPNDQQNKEEPIPTQTPNKEALRPQTNNSRSGLKIKAPTSIDRNTPTQQLPSPLASSSEDEGESQLKKTTIRAIRPPPPRIAPLISANNGPLEKNEPPFFAKPVHRKRDPKIMLQRALARREAHSYLETKHTPFASRFPTHMQPSANFRGMMTPVPHPRFDRECDLSVRFSQAAGMMRTPEITRKHDATRHTSTERAKRPAANKRRIQKKVRESYAQSQARSHAENESLEALLKQLIADKAEGFHSYEEVARRRQECAKDVQRMREADTKVDKIPPLTPEQIKLVKKTIVEVERDSRMGLNKRYVEKFKIPISTPDLLRMRPDAWLNDEVINFYLSMIVDRSLKAHPNEPQKILAHSTFFFPKLEGGGHKAVARWAKRLGVSGEDLLKLDYMFVPVHVARTHWCLAVANFKLKRFEYYDSLGGNFTPQRRSVYYAAMREYVEKETGKSCADWIDFSMKGAPQQSNNSDCGVFTIKTAETIARGGKMSFSASDMPLIRQRAIVEVLRGELLPWVED